MRVVVYIDGFNLYYRALKGTRYKWLNPLKLSERLLDDGDEIGLIRYFTARVSARAGDKGAPRRQQIYLNALKSVPQVKFHFGRFLPKKKRRPLVSTGQFVEIHDTEEKGSDVNLATHLLNDAWKADFGLALVLSQDTDLVETIRIVTQERRLKVGLVWLDGRQPNNQLAKVASFVRHVKPADLAASQFDEAITLDDGRVISRPPEWR